MAKVRILGVQVKGHGQNFLHQWNDLITSNVHVKYESFTSDGSKVMTKVEVFRNVGQGYDQGHKAIYLGFI